MSTTEIDPLSFKEPAGLRPLLSGYVTEVLRFQPENIVLFSKDYFTAMSNGQLQEFLAHQNANLNANLKTLQDYANVTQPARAPAPEDEDPTEREIREMRSRAPAAAAPRQQQHSPQHGQHGHHHEQQQQQEQEYYADIPVGQSLEEAEAQAHGADTERNADNDAEDEEMLELQQRLRQMEADGEM